MMRLGSTCGIVNLENEIKELKAYIQQLYKPKESDQFYKFIALVAVWAEQNQTIKESDLQNPQNVSVHIQNIANCLGITINHEFVETVKFSLSAYTKFLLLYRNDSREYTFSHNVISEMVGVVLGKYKPRECIQLCHRDFLMKRVTIIETEKSDLQVLVPETMYTDLCEKLIKLLICNEWTEEQQSVRVLDRFVKTVTHTFPNKHVDSSVVEHEAFRNRSFAKVFTKNVVEKNLVVRLFNYPTMDTYQNDVPFYLLDHILINNHLFLAQEIISQNELFLKTTAKLCSESLCVVIDKLPHLLSNVLKSDRALLNSKCSPKQEPYFFDGNVKTFTYPLIVATSLNKIDCVKCLLEHGARINVKDSEGKTALHCAVYDGHSDVKTELLNCKADVNIRDNYGLTPFHIAVFRGDSDMMKELLDSRADVNVRDKSGFTALNIAVKYGHLNAVKTCVKYGADENMMMECPSTALHLAAFRGHSVMTKALLYSKCFSNVRDESDETPLHFASREGHILVVKMCLKYGTDVNIMDNYNQTALHIAASCGHTDVMKELLDCKADVNAKDKNGNTPLHIATEAGHLKAIKTCLKYET